jgi:hypothetical protein
MVEYGRWKWPHCAERPSLHEAILRLYPEEHHDS